MFKVGDKVKLKKNASTLYKAHFKANTVYEVCCTEYGTVCVYVTGKSGAHGTANEDNFEFAPRIYVGGE